MWSCRCNGSAQSSGEPHAGPHATPTTARTRRCHRLVGLTLLRDVARTTACGWPSRQVLDTPRPPVRAASPPEFPYRTAPLWCHWRTPAWREANWSGLRHADLPTTQAGLLNNKVAPPIRAGRRAGNGGGRRWEERVLPSEEPPPTRHHRLAESSPPTQSPSQRPSQGAPPQMAPSSLDQHGLLLLARAPPGSEHGPAAMVAGNLHGDRHC